MSDEKWDPNDHPVFIGVMTVALVAIVAVGYWQHHRLEARYRQPPPQPAAPAPVSAVQPLALELQCQAVKKVGDKYRYFFTAWNRGDTDRKFELTLRFVTAEGVGIGRERFTGDIQAGGASSWYTDRLTSPLPSVHGSSAYRQIEYTATDSHDRTIASGIIDIP